VALGSRPVVQSLPTDFMRMPAWTTIKRHMDRAAWIREQRRINEERMDMLFAPIYDEHWGGHITPTHQRMVERFLALLPSRAHVLDAACGTGKYWPLLLQTTHSLLGIDQSGGMVRRAQAKFPEVPTEKLGLQELSFQDTFDGIVCIDAIENVFPEDWPPVLQNFYRALQSRGFLYLTVEIPEDDLPTVFQTAVEAGLPVVEGEWVHEGAYHYYPTVDQVRAWVEAAGFVLLDEAVGDGYHHLLLRRG